MNNKTPVFAQLPGQPCPETFSKVWNFGKVNPPVHICKTRLENPMQPAAKGQIVWKISRSLQQKIKPVGKSPATLRQGFQTLESLLQGCGKVSATAEVPLQPA